MKIEIKKVALYKAISIVNKAVSSTPKRDVLKGILIVAESEGIYLTGYNEIFAIRHFIPCETDGELQINVQESGSIVLPEKHLTQITSNFRQEWMSIEIDEDNKAVIYAESKKSKKRVSKHDLNGYSSKDFPVFPGVETTGDYEKGFVISSNKLKEIISDTIFAISTSEIRPIITGERWVYENEELIIESTDAHRLARRRTEVKGDKDTIDFVFPGKSLMELEKILNESNASIYTNGTSVLISFGNTTFISRTLEGVYPNTSKIIPEKFSTEIKINRLELIKALDGCNVFNGGKNPLIKIQILNDSTVSLTSVESGVGSAEEVMECTKLSGDSISIKLNRNFLYRALKALSEKEEVIIRMAGPLLPVVIQYEDREDHVQLMLPMR
ncbi:DNA polymerase III, beta subunit [Brevibacillus laterosporus GI-9]|uniref:DNA polymerase III subunit beta n=1 Tax=Brevibacillus laterosporus TaxID=1465 RepID=UPI00024052D9|nr:DNA polymerase III subunit beta [Brevibacillus laterosporus]CCF17022.1 DNA polymerase III, beta subunit [Brevibacillus laterosporus GI-9]